MGSEYKLRFGVIFDTLFLSLTLSVKKKPNDSRRCINKFEEKKAGNAVLKKITKKGKIARSLVFNVNKKEIKTSHQWLGKKIQKYELNDNGQ